MKRLDHFRDKTYNKADGETDQHMMQRVFEELVELGVPEPSELRSITVGQSIIENDWRQVTVVFFCKDANYDDEI